MVTDLSDYDLLNVIRTRNLTDEYVRFFSYQVAAVSDSVAWM